jgi:hypothetical protein
MENFKEAGEIHKGEYFKGGVDTWCETVGISSILKNANNATISKMKRAN